MSSIRRAWPHVTLGEIASRITDGTHQPPKFQPSGIPFLFVSNIYEGCLSYETEKFIDRGTYEELNRRCPVEVGDVLFTTVGSYGNAAVVISDQPFSFQRHVAHIKPDPKRILSSYLRMALESAPVRRQVDSRVRGIAQKTLNLADLRLLSLLLPPLSEQRRIADILDKANTVRRKRQEAIKLTEEFLRSAFLEMFGDPATNPNGWQLHPLNSLVEDGRIRNGLSPSSRGLHAGQVLVLSAITGETFDPTSIKPAFFDMPPPEDKLVDIRDFLICRGNGNLNLVGRAKFPLANLPGILFPDTIIGVRVDLEKVCRAYLEAVWNSSFVRGQLESGARTTNGTFKINQKVIEAVRIPLPPISMQERFEAIVTAMRQYPRKDASQLSDELFRSLEQRAFRGEL